MDPRAYLTELGYSADDINAMLSDEKQSKLISATAKNLRRSQIRARRRCSRESGNGNLLGTEDTGTAGFGQPPECRAEKARRSRRS